MAHLLAELKSVSVLIKELVNQLWSVLYDWPEYPQWRGETASTKYFWASFGAGHLAG
jgi:hypothetical protein